MGNPVIDFVKRGVESAARGLQLYAGPGVSLTSTADGTLISFDGSGLFFAHPFRVSGGGGSFAVRPGLINGVGGTIGGKPLDPEPGEIAPRLVVKSPRLDAHGRGWIAAEVTLSEKDWSVKSWEVVQVASLETDDGGVPKNGAAPESAGGFVTLSGRRVRQPLALLRDRGGRLVIFQFTYFHLTHRARIGTSADKGRHFFFPAG